MIGAIAGIIDFSRQNIDPVRIGKMSELLGNDLVIREQKEIQPWLYLAQITLHNKTKKLHQWIQSKGDYVVVGDTLLANRSELVDLLGLWDRHDQTDHALLLEAFLKWGPDCVHHLEGNYAFAIWDGPNNRLFCAVDPLGKRPFYYSFVSGELLFASEIKSILAVRKNTYDYNYSFFIDDLEGLPFDEETTYLNEVHRLPAGTFIIISPSGTQTCKYWSPGVRGKVIFQNDEDYVDAVQELSIKLCKEYFSDEAKIGLWLNGNKESAYDLAILRHAFPEKEIIASSYILPVEEKSSAPGHEQLIYKLKSAIPFELIPVYEVDLPTEYDNSIENKMWVNDSPTVNPIGSDHKVLYPSLRERGIYKMSSNLFYNPFNWNGSEHFRNLILSGQGGSFLHQLARSNNKTQILKSTIKSLVPHKLVSKLKMVLKRDQFYKCVLTQEAINEFQFTSRYIRKSRYVGQYPFLHQQKEHLVQLNKRFRPSPKPLTSIERRYDITPLQTFTDRRILDLALSIPATQYMGSASFLPLFHRLLQKNNIPDEIIKNNIKTSWPVDMKARMEGIRKALLKEFDQIEKDSEVWQIVDHKKACSLFQLVKGNKSFAIYRQYYNKMNSIVLLNRFLRLNKK